MAIARAMAMAIARAWDTFELVYKAHYVPSLIFPSLSRHRGRPPVRSAHPGWTQRRGGRSEETELIFKLPGNTRLTS